MMPALNSILWCVVQTSIVTTVALVIAGSLRGRFPQWTSALLAGAGLCILVLAVLALIPQSHWSLLDAVGSQEILTDSKGHDQRSSSFSDNGSNGKAEISSQSKDDSMDAVLATSESTGDDQNSSLHPRTSHEKTVEGSSLDRMLGVATGWIVGKLQKVDDRFRGYEQVDSEYTARIAALKWTVIAVMGLLSGMWLLGWKWVRELISQSALIDDSDLQFRLNRLCQSMKCRVPELRQSSKIAVGATVGFWRPRIILNQKWQTWTDDQLDAVLLHELAHLIRGDFAWVVLGSWLRVLFFYHPLVLLLVRQWRIEQELAADQVAANWMKSAKAYGRALASLALQVQVAHQTRAAVLTAEQVCIVRRVTMLKQGSLKPSRYHWRAVMLFTSLTVVGLIPLSGVRGKTALADDNIQEAQRQSTAEEPTEETEETRKLTEEQKAKRAEFKRTQETFPPLEIVGRLKWCPGKLVTHNIDPTALYFQDLIAFTILEQFPEKAEINCPTTVKFAWEDLKREHGRLDIGAMCNQSHGLDSKLMARMLTSHALGAFLATSTKKVIEGKEAVGVVTSHWNNELSAREYEAEPNIWLVQDGDEFYYGSEADVASRIRKANGTESDDDESIDTALIEVPAPFLDDFENSALALVYADCDQWESRLRKHLEGSPKQAEAALIYPFLSGLDKIGLFANSENGATLRLRVRYDSEKSAERGAKGMRSLIAMARATNDLDKTLMAIIDSLQVETIGRETVLTSRPVSALRLAQDSLFAETVKDWTAVLSTIVTPKSESRWLDGKLVTNQGTDKGIAKLNCGNPRFGTACFMSQSLKAPNYQGKRVRLIAELGCEELMHHHSGVILWAADAQDNTVSNATSGNSMTLIEEKNLAMDKLFLIRDVPPPVVWREHSVEMDVSDKATVLSLGIYTSIADVLLRNVRYEVVGEATGEQPKHSLVNAPRNLLHLPGGVLLDQPTNLDFSKLPEDAPKPTSGSDQPARTAARPASGNTTR